MHPKDLEVTGFPEVDSSENATEAEKIFEFYTPQETSGYIRKLLIQDCEGKNYTGDPPVVGLFAYFDAGGQLRFWHEEFDGLMDLVEEKQFDAYPVH